MSALWTSDEIAAATGGTASAPFEVTGVTFDSREVGPATCSLQCPARSMTATSSSTRRSPPALPVRSCRSRSRGRTSSSTTRLLRCKRSAALRANGADATIVGVTGSVGKTSTKEALFAALDRNRPGKVHRSVKSYNNHTGVPLSLARMPRDAGLCGARNGHEQQGRDRRADAAGPPACRGRSPRSRPRTSRTSAPKRRSPTPRPRYSKGLEPGGVAIVPNDTPHRDRLVKAARRHADRIITFGGGDADVHAVHAVTAEGGGSLISAALLERELTFTISQRGEHWVSNSLAVLAAVEALGADVAARGSRACRPRRAQGPRRAAPHRASTAARCC